MTSTRSEAGRRLGRPMPKNGLLEAVRRRIKFDIVK